MADLDSALIPLMLAGRVSRRPRPRRAPPRPPRPHHLAARPHRHVGQHPHRRADPVRSRTSSSDRCVLRRRQAAPDRRRWCAVRRGVDGREPVRAPRDRRGGRRCARPRGSRHIVLEPFDIVEEAQVTSVLVETSVQDKTGRFVKSLPPAAFSLLEDGAPQTLDLARQRPSARPSRCSSTAARACRAGSTSSSGPRPRSPTT